jgi:predicted dinucleotide-binding enzyme
MIMKIGIIGAGQIGGALAHKLTRLGHSVAIANSRGPETLTALAKETGARATTAPEVVKDAELVVVTIPQKNVPSLPKSLFAQLPASAVIVDTGNYYPSFRDGHIAAMENGTTESRWVAQQIGRPVVKVFNNIMARNLLNGGRPRGDKQRIALPVAGDDATAKKVVIDLLDALGFDGVDAGTIDESWRQEPGSPVYGTDFDAEGVKQALAQADRSRSPVLREALVQKMGKMAPDASTADFLHMWRSVHEQSP